jgi:SAM-dependent methyltransferase
MKSYQLLERIVSLESIASEIRMGITDSEFETVDADGLASYLESLRKLVTERNIPNAARSKILSSRMSPDRLTANEYDSFYSHINFSNQQKEILTRQISNLISFEFPVLELFAGQGHFTASAVGGEPLYIADYYMQTLDKVGAQFNDFFHGRRLIKQEVRDFDLSMLPQNQFGLVFSFNYFMAKDEEFILNWAAEVFKILRPGGHFVFNFIPHDTLEGLEIIENNTVSAIDHLYLEEKLRDLDFEIMKKELTRGMTSSMVIRKPGDLAPFKLSSSLARIIDNSEPFV